MAWKSGQSYSGDLRSRVLGAIDGGSPARATAQLFQVSVSYIYRALARREATGETEARPLVTLKSEAQLDLQALHRARERLVAARTWSSPPVPTPACAGW